MIKVALVGAGGMGTNHLNCYGRMEGAEVVGVCDIRDKNRTEMAQKLSAREYTDYIQMLDTEKPDLLDICTPSYLHCEMAVEAMKRGIHVISEKPAALGEKDVTTMFDAAEKYGVKFMVAHVLRFWPEYTYLKHAVQNNVYGKLYDLRLTRIGRAPAWSWNNWMADPALSGGVPYDLHIHDLDFMVSLLGLPKKVSYKRFIKESNRRLDHVHAQYEYDDLCVFAEAAWMDAFFPFQASFLAEFEDAVLEYKGGKLTVYRWEKEPEEILFGGDSNVGLDIPATDGYYNELKYFVEHVRDNAPIDCMTKEEICGVMRLIDTEYAG